MNKKPYLSFCIPTYNRLEILQNTLESIYADLNGIEMDDFEVIVSDNEPNQSAKNIIEKFHYANLIYCPTNCIGFLNSFNALKCGNGQFLKLHNNYTKLRKGTLKKIITDIKENSDKKNMIFYTDGLKQTGRIMKFDTYDSFMYELSYFSSWSTGFGIWKEDFYNVCDSIDIDTYFPQTSLLLSQYNKTRFIINDKPIFDNQDIPKKGGYNIFKVFAVDFIQLIEHAYQKNYITNRTFEKIKSDLLFDYLSVRYFKTVIMKIDKFEKDNIKNNISMNYPSTYYYYMIFFSIYVPFKVLLRGMKLAFIKLQNR